MEIGAQGDANSAPFKVKPQKLLSQPLENREGSTTQTAASGFPTHPPGHSAPTVKRVVDSAVAHALLTFARAGLACPAMSSLTVRDSVISTVPGR